MADLVGDIHDYYWVDSSSYRDSWPYGSAEALTSTIGAGYQTLRVEEVVDQDHRCPHRSLGEQDYPSRKGSF
jgi:hypothetical protein